MYLNSFLSDENLGTKSNNISRIDFDLLANELGLDDITRERIQELILNTNRQTTAILSKLGIRKDEDVAKTIASISGKEVFNEQIIVDDIFVKSDISKQFLLDNLIIPIRSDEQKLVCAISDPYNLSAQNGILFALQQKSIEVFISTVTEIERALAKYFDINQFDEIKDDYGIADSSLNNDIETLRNLAEDAPIVRMLDNIIAETIEQRGTDLHIEIKSANAVIRIRVDGKLRTVSYIPINIGIPLVSRLKIIAGLDVANSRSPQDGRSELNVKGRKIDIRVSTIPAANGESAAIRILDRHFLKLDFESLGFAPHAINTLNEIISAPHGLTIITGPTGSGKTTTLYAALEKIKSAEIKIITIEDPIEYRIEEINQVQVNNAAGVSFASALRSFLRQDPDVILVGEIRDSETAKIAIQAALTGHLVLATLHTNDAISAIPRLIDMGIEPLLLASVLNGVASQRLVRKLCNFCKVETIDQFSGKLEFKAMGCSKCNGTGYYGRTALIEVFKSDNEICDAIYKKHSYQQIKDDMIGKGYCDLRLDGMFKVEEGETSLSEVLSVIS